MDVVNVLPRDAIPSIDDPEFGTAYIGTPDDRVLVLDGSPARAYPLRILHYHEIVNDDLRDDDASDPIAITWCPLCGSAVVYEREVNGRTLTFGVSGKLADDDLVMYDRETGSEWKQSLGECIAGEFEGTRLTARAASIITWERFRGVYPDGLVLQPPHLESEVASDDDTPAGVDYDISPYERYFREEGFGLGARRSQHDPREWNRDDIDPKTVVLGLEIGDDALGFPLHVVRNARGIVRTSVGDTSVVIFEADGELHAFLDPGIEFDAVDGNYEGDGTRWDPTSGRAEDGRRLERVPARRLFAFTWQDDHGADAFYGLGPCNDTSDTP